MLDPDELVPADFYAWLGQILRSHGYADGVALRHPKLGERRGRPLWLVLAVRAVCAAYPPAAANKGAVWVALGRLRRSPEARDALRAVVSASPGESEAALRVSEYLRSAGVLE